MINDHEVKNLFSKNNKFSTVFDELIQIKQKPSDFSEGFYSSRLSGFLRLSQKARISLVSFSILKNNELRILILYISSKGSSYSNFRIFR